MPLLVVGLVLAQIAVSVGLQIAWGGVRHGGDTTVYLGGAERLLSGDALPGKTPLYSGYVALLVLADLVGAGHRGVVLLQTAVGALAVLAVFHLGRSLSGSWAGLAAAALLVAYVDITRWQVYLLTDSLFIAMVVITVLAAHHATVAGGWWYAPAAAALAFTASLRPNGWLLVPVVLVYWSHRVFARRPVRWTASATVVAGFVAAVLVLPFFRGAVDREAPAALLRAGAVTWDREVVSERSAAEAGGTSGVVAYALEHPVDTATLAARRVGTALAQVRPHYSSRHNLFILVVLVPTYASAAWGVWVHRRHPLTRLALGVVGVQLAFIAGTFADYDGRFMAYVLPLVMVLAGAGAADAARRWTS